MKTKYTYIHFEKVDDVWQCCKNKTNKVLGVVYWHKRWQVYVYAPMTMNFLSIDCLKNITDFMDKLTATTRDNNA